MRACTPFPPKHLADGPGRSRTLHANSASACCTNISTCLSDRLKNGKSSPQQDSNRMDPTAAILCLHARKRPRQQLLLVQAPRKTTIRDFTSPIDTTIILQASLASEYPSLPFNITTSPRQDGIGIPRIDIGIDPLETTALLQQ